MVPQRRSTIYSTPEEFRSIAQYLKRESQGPLLLLGIGNRGKKFVNFFGNIFDKCEVPHFGTAYVLQSDGYEEGYKRIVDAVPYSTNTGTATSGKPQGTGTAIIFDDLIDTFEQGAGANFYSLEKKEDLGFTKNLLTIVHYDFLGVAHFSLDTENKNHVVVGDRDRLVGRLRELGPQKFLELQDSGKIRYIGRVNSLRKHYESLEVLEEQRPSIKAYLRDRLGRALSLKASKPSEIPQKRSANTHEEFVDQIASGE